MEDDREKRLREESEQAYQRWLRETGRTEQETAKPKKRKTSVGMQLLKQLAIIGALFFALAFALNWLLSFLFKLPGLGMLPGWVLPVTSALSATCLAAVVGQKVATKKRSAVIALAFLGAFVPISFFFIPQVSPIPAPTPIPLPPPSPVPEGYVEFYYQASFTFLGGETSTISNVELWLPWPYIDTKETRPLAKPVGLDKWLHVENGHYFEGGPAGITQTYEYLVSVLRPKEGEVDIIENDNINFSFALNIENGIWTTSRIIDRTEVENLEIVFEGQHDTTLVLAYFEPTQDKKMTLFQKITVKIPIISTGDTVTIKYRFFIQKENATKVRVDDWLESYIVWILSGVYKQRESYENAPEVYALFSGSPIRCKFLISLHKNVNSNWEKVVFYQRTWDTWYSGFGMVSDKFQL